MALRRTALLFHLPRMLFKVAMTPMAVLSLSIIVLPGLIVVYECCRAADYFGS